MDLKYLCIGTVMILSFVYYHTIILLFVFPYDATDDNEADIKSKK